jgi:hypothetical protein
LSGHRRASLALFAASVLFVPVPFYMIVVGGLVPLAWICLICLQGLADGLPKLTGEGLFMAGFLLAHVLILGGLLYLASALVCWVLLRLLPARLARLVVALLIAGGATASAFEIYRLPGHNSSPPANIVRVFRAS